MIIYVVTEYDNGMDSWLAHLASSMEKAEEWVKNNPSRYGEGSYDIAEWELDKGYLTASAIATIDCRVEAHESEIRS